MLSRHRSFVAALTIAIAPFVLSAQSGTTIAQIGTRGVTAVPGPTSPRYPDSLRTARVPGGVVAEFVVDTTGFADPASIKIVRATNSLFADAVRNALPTMRFRPADVSGRKIRQTVQQPIVFNLVGSPESDDEIATREFAYSHVNPAPDAPSTQAVMLGLIVIRANPAR